MVNPRRSTSCIDYNVSVSEPVETQRLHRYPRAHREYSQRFLAHDMARKCVLHRHVNQDVRLYQGLNLNV